MVKLSWSLESKGRVEKTLCTQTLRDSEGEFFFYLAPVPEEIVADHGAWHIGTWDLSNDVPGDIICAGDDVIQLLQEAQQYIDSSQDAVHVA